ncbi:hypothetical protein TEQG_02718 [Trichophyton equinum CBS 127.97]|uniref:Uncharacterized protein n=1 Tax=Trichophyton equinum (strain ATCC MYA-4606 / CBS 127.97) TaxID=559882 RepID=F2PP69_TRIEC|nr:hypothetical protein TEQG_02718 [Trichophyton equinum CBS 127.97]
MDASVPQPVRRFREQRENTLFNWLNPNRIGDSILVSILKFMGKCRAYRGQ